MSIATQAATAATTATSPTSGSRSSGFGSDFNTFLTLLTTQLKNQDPTNAMDPQQMTAQLVQFAQVEQSITMNDNMTKLIGLQQAAQLTAAAPLMGKMVEVASDQLSLQDGTARLRLPAAGAAREVTITILDNLGRTLREETVALGSTATEWQWDGRDAMGRSLPDGAYSFVVAGRDADGTPQPVEVTVRARATAAERTSGPDGGELRLVLGGLTVGFDAVRSLDGGN
ncbi:MAG: flagellar hook capping FlgD N-terminal domain-containing protein [Acetobacteraceae bacterium]|nr:flagellar hook assembly protein FlgD [Acetobacteraceae bacterium]MDI3308685.1 flagellar hook capping FlgD N-terminal domain-containing protein [Acetobacteraceae bacterium]